MSTWDGVEPLEDWMERREKVHVLVIQAALELLALVEQEPLYLFEDETVQAINAFREIVDNHVEVV